MAVGGEANQIICDADAGVSAEPDNILSIESAIIELLSRRNEWEEMGRNGRRFYEAEMSRGRGVSKIVSVLKDLQN